MTGPVRGTEEGAGPPTVTAERPVVRLSRNRNYTLLWGGQVFSEVGFNVVTIAFPLLVLVITGSAAASGLVMGTSAAAQLVAGLPAGAVADRWSRKKVMLLCEAGQALAMGSLVVTLVLGVLGLWQIVAVAAVMGVCRSFFEPAEHATLPGVVAAEQVGPAVAVNAARQYLGQLSGTALGGFLFALRQLVPFLADTVLHVVSFTVLTFLRLPAQRLTKAPMSQFIPEIGQGLRWVWRQKLVRATSTVLVAVNFFFTAFYIVIIVLSHQRGLGAGEIGVMAAMFGVGGLLGALAAPFLLRVLSPYLSIIGVLWMLTVLTPVAILIHSGYVMGVLLAAMAFLAPTANTTIQACQLLLTPDELRGRLSSVISVLGGAAAAAGPAVGGLLAGLAGGDEVILLCTAGILVLTVLATLSPTLRAFPNQRDLAAAS